MPPPDQKRFQVCLEDAAFEVKGERFYDSSVRFQKEPVTRGGEMRELTRDTLLPVRKRLQEERVGGGAPLN